MTTYTRLVSIINAIATDVDLASNSLNVNTLFVGSTSPVELTKTILGRLISTQDGSDLDATYHTHNTLYYTKTQFNARTSTPGASLVGVERKTYSNITGYTSLITDTLANYNVQALFDAVNSSLGTISSDFLDTAFRISDDGDNTKKIAFEAAGISTGTTRTITMPDANVDLGNLTNSNISASAAIAYSKLAALTASRALVSDGSGFVSASSVTSTELGYVSGVTSSIQTQLDGKVAKAGSSMNSGANITFAGGGEVLGLPATPTTDGSAASKAYVDAVALGLAPKKAVYVATTTAGTLASSFENGDVVDGVTLTTGMRILIKDQATASQNGIYTVNASGAPTRATDFDSVSPIDEINGAWVPVQFGTVNAGRVYVQYGTVSTVGSDAITFEFYNPIASLIGGDMITVSGSTISIDLASTSGLESTNAGNAAGQLRVKLEASNPTLQIDGSNQLGVKFSASTSALQAVAGGLAVKLEASNPTLFVTGSNELAVKLNTGATTGNITTSATGLKVDTDGSTLETASNALRIKDLGVTTAKLAASSVTKAKLNSDVAGYGLTQESDGSLAVRNSFAALTNGNGSTLNAGAVVYMTSTASTFDASDADAIGTSKGTVGVLLANTATSATGQVQVSGRATVQVESGSLTPGELVYVSSTPGKVTMTAPSASGAVVFTVGVACSTTEVILRPQFMYQVG